MKPGTHYIRRLGGLLGRSYNNQLLLKQIYSVKGSMLDEIGRDDEENRIESLRQEYIEQNVYQQNILKLHFECMC
jgi:hypothetical protein